MNSADVTVAGQTAEDIETAAPAVFAEPTPVLPIKAGDIIKYTPLTAQGLSPAPVYHLRVPSISERASIDRATTIRCGNPIDDRTLGLLLRRGVKEAYEADEVDEIMAQLSERDAAAAAGFRLTEDTVDQAEGWRQIEQRVITGFRPYAVAIADRSYRAALMPLIAVQHMLVDWENVAAGPLERKGGIASEASISQINRTQYTELWIQCLSHLGLGVSLAKN